ncbi:MAG: DUF3035 domain-containing protein [Acetobacteraceae bacterium]|nr:DUF3035 domain-containing protein [Acetobacteraceae bacterium]
MRRFRTFPLGAWALLLGSAFGLSGCGENVNRFFGLVRDAPDEFQVTTRAPLSMPTEFKLSPPRPGASRPQELSERQQAEQVLTPALALENPSPVTPSPGQQALLTASGPQAAPNIRDQVAADARHEVYQRSFVQRMLFWQTPKDPSVIVDAEREAKRLRENAALGQDSRAGDTAVEQPKRRSFFDSIF